MFAIPRSLSRAGSDVMGTVSAMASVFTHASTSLAYIAEAGSTHAEAYLDNAKAQVLETAVIRRVARTEEVKVDCARRLVHLKQELDSNVELRDLYESLDLEDFDLLKRPMHSTPTLVHAAE